MGYSLSLNGDVDGEPLCLAITSGLIAVLQGLNHWEGSVNSVCDFDGVGGRAPNCKHGIESEDEGARTKRGKVAVGIVGNVNLNESGEGNRLGVVGGRWAGWGAERNRPC